jgi:hypothetical protein
MKGCIISLFLFTSFAYSQKVAYDFAPMSIGNTWSYSYVYIFGGDTAQSFNVDIAIQSMRSSGTDTIVLLRISEIYKFRGLDTTISYFDSVLIHNDSIIAGEDYRCPVNPFWHTHGILYDSLKTAILGSDSILYFGQSKPKSSNAYWSELQYVKDRGLYWYYWETYMLAPQIDEIRLLAFNGQKTPGDLSTRNRNSANTRIRQTRNHLQIANIVKHDKPFVKSTLLNGKRFNRTHSISAVNAVIR